MTLLDMFAFVVGLGYIWFAVSEIYRLGGHNGIRVTVTTLLAEGVIEGDDELDLMGGDEEKADVTLYFVHIIALVFIFAITFLRGVA